MGQSSAVNAMRRQSTVGQQLQLRCHHGLTLLLFFTTASTALQIQDLQSDNDDHQANLMARDTRAGSGFQHFLRGKKESELLTSGDGNQRPLASAANQVYSGWISPPEVSRHVRSFNNHFLRGRRSFPPLDGVDQEEADEAPAVDEDESQPLSRNLRSMTVQGFLRGRKGGMPGVDHFLRGGRGGSSGFNHFLRGRRGSSSSFNHFMLGRKAQSGYDHFLRGRRDLENDYHDLQSLYYDVAGSNHIQYPT